MVRKKKEVRTIDMDTLGYFIYMDEMEKQQQEDSDEGEDDESN